MIMNTETVPDTLPAPPPPQHCSWDGTADTPYGRIAFSLSIRDQDKKPHFTWRQVDDPRDSDSFPVNAHSCFGFVQQYIGVRFSM